MDNWAKNLNFWDIQTDGHGSSLTDPARRIESVNMLNCDNKLTFQQNTVCSALKILCHLGCVDGDIFYYNLFNWSKLGNLE